MQKITGHCLCGACRFELTGAHIWVGHCHCESCRRATGSPVTTFIGHPEGAWRWIAENLREYESSPGVTRGFCGTCGSAVTFRSVRWPGETHFYAALLDDPAPLSVTQVYHADEALPWAPPVTLADTP